MESPGAPPPAPAGPRRAGLLVAVGLIAALAVAGAFLWWFLSRDGLAGRRSADGSPGPAAAARTAVEAESATALVEPLRRDDDGQASGRMCLALPSAGCADGKHLHPAEGAAPPGRVAGSAQVPFTVSAQGEYVLWIRKWWCCAQGDAFVVELDGGRSYVFGDDGSDFRKWSWLDLREGGRPVRFKLAPGRHVLLIRGRGESGFKVDQLLFTTDAAFRPKGVEKP